MRHYTVSRIQHTVYESSDELPDDIYPVDNWRESEVGDWVRTDDGCYAQILRKGLMSRPKGKVRKVPYFGICTGTFAGFKSTKMDTSKRENIYSFSGNMHNPNVRNTLNRYERLFIEYLTSGMSPAEAYLKAFPTNNPGYAGFKSAELTKTTRIKKAMKKELEPLLEKLGISPETILSGIKLVAETAEKDDTKLKALFKLSDILDLEDKNSPNVQQITGVQFQGFSNEQLESAQRPKEISNE